MNGLKQIKIFYHKSIAYLENNPKLRFVFSPMAGAIIGGAIYLNNPTDQSAVSTGIVSCLMLLIGWPQIFKNKYTN